MKKAQFKGGPLDGLMLRVSDYQTVVFKDESGAEFYYTRIGVLVNTPIYKLNEGEQTKERMESFFEKFRRYKARRT